MREFYLLLAVVAVMMFHGMMEQFSMFEKDALKQDNYATNITTETNKPALMLAQGFK